MNHICFNGKIIDASEPVFTSTNRGYRYGDGFFETMRVANRTIPLLTYHIKRIQYSLQLLGYTEPVHSLAEIVDQIFELCEKNKCSHSARVRLSFSNGNGSVFDANQNMDYLIEAVELNSGYNTLNENGLTTGLCHSVKKSCDSYANLKSANYLFSRVAAEFAKEKSWDDALILNQHNHICETTVTNIFWIKNNEIFTPPLSEGCVKGVMRAYLINTIGNVAEKICTLEDLKNADEIFLTNAVTGIRWVWKFENTTYHHKKTSTLYKELISPLFHEK